MIILPFRPDASWGHPPVGTIALMLALLLIHIAWGRGDPEALQPYLLNFQTISPLQWLTSALLHADWMHLIGNLVFLFVFGAIVEDYLGHWLVPAFVALALSSGALEQGLGLLGHREGFALGASSAIYGLMTLAVLWAPQTRVSTFVWLILHKPLIVEIRVLWLAGGYMAMQILGVWLQGGRPSSEFLHACGIAVGLPLGLLCLRERWVKTDGGDLLATDAPRTTASTQTEAQPTGVPWDEQAARLTTAVAAGDRRVALAAYDVLRREHPDRQPATDVTEGLVALCEEGLDFHRAAAVAERAVAAGSVSDALRLRLARVRGQHLGDADAGLAQLVRIRCERLDDEARAEYDRLRARLERRRKTERLTRNAPTSAALAVLLATTAFLPGTAFAGDAEPDPWAAPASTPDPFAQPVDPFAAPTETAPVELKPALEPVDPQVVTGRLTVPGGASINIPDDLVYLPWPEVLRFLSTPPTDPHEVPLGLIITEDQFASLSEERARVGSHEEWSQRSFRFLLSEGPVQVQWEDGWIDTSEGLPPADQLLTDYQLHARLITRRQAMGPGISITVDNWARQPTFNATTGVLAWAIQTGLQSQIPGVLNHAADVAHICHLGARGTLRLVCDGVPGSEEVAERMQRISAHVTWDAGSGFAVRQPDQVGERVGGFRRVMLPRLVFGNPADDELVYRHRGLGYAWILILLPVAVAVVLFLRRMRAASRPIPVAAGAASRCQACGSPVQATAARCIACGKSLVQRSG